MGSMTLTEMRSSLRWDLDNRGGLTEAQLNRWLNWSYLHISQPNIHMHQSLQSDTGNLVTLATGTVSYNIGTLAAMRFHGIYSTTYVRGTDYSDYSTTRRKLRGGLDIRHFDESLVGEGEPSRYAIWGGNAAGQIIYVDHRPSSAENGNVLLVRGYREPTQLTTANQVTVLPSIWDEIILMGAKWRGWRSLNRPERAEPARVEFGLQINEIPEATYLDAQDWGGQFEFELTDYQQGL